MGPVTPIEYESRLERYDQQLRENVGIDPTNLSTTEKIKRLKEYRLGQYELLLDAVYERRGWDNNSIPTKDKIKELGLDLPEVMDVLDQAN